LALARRPAASAERLPARQPPRSALALDAAARPRRPVPTRRSSDLLRIEGTTETRRSTRSTRSARSTEKAAEAGTRLIATTVKSKDRKSTRLNSSHVKISYAVFCLKKKIHAARRLLLELHRRGVAHN